jgi:hypothetical protein
MITVTTREWIDGAATWRAADAPALTGPLTSGRGRAPRMAYWPWQIDQGVEVAATDRDAWYWRCPVRGCRHWAGPYPDRSEAKCSGMFHRYHCED